MNIVSVKHFCFTYPDGKEILKDVSFELGKGEMLLISGENGCGKTTLLRSLKKEIAPKGKKSGEININGECAFLFQESDKNIIFRSPYEDLIFYACNLGIDADIIDQKAKEVIEMFNLSHLMDRNTDTFSGGEKQILALASLLVTEPDLIILDEPLSQLDEQSKEMFLQKLLFAKQNLSATIIIAEHNTDKLLENCDKFIYFKNAETLTVQNGALNERLNAPNLPEYIKLENKFSLPYKSFKTSEAAENINSIKDKLILQPRKSRKLPEENILEIKSLLFYYDEELLKDVNFTLKRGEISFVQGKNGAGKSTLFKLILSFLKAKKGEIKLAPNTQIGYLAQNPIYSFLKDTLEEDYKYILARNGMDEEKIAKTAQEFSDYESLKPLFKSNPLDLSGGERAKAAMFKMLLLNKNLILLDEPEKHLDKMSCEALSAVIKSLADKGISFLIISHTPDFIYRTADSVKLLKNGKIEEYKCEEYFTKIAQTSLFSSLRECNIPLRTAEQTEVEHG